MSGKYSSMLHLVFLQIWVNLLLSVFYTEDLWSLLSYHNLDRASSNAVLACTHPPPVGGWGTCQKCLHLLLTPNPQLDKKMLLKYFFKCFFYKIRSLKCLFNSIILKQFYKWWKKKEEKLQKQREENRKKQDEEKEDREWKEWKNENNVKDGNEEDLERSNISDTVLYE